MKNYKFILLGGSGAGKTIFLASFYKLLSTQGRLGFFLDVEDTVKRKALNRVYEQITIGEDWPPGTRTTSEWTFICCVKSPNLSNVQVCKLTYFDYAGGTLTDESAETSDDGIESKLSGAKAVLVILDGQKLLYFMQDEALSNPIVLQWIRKDLVNMLQLLNKFNNSTSVYFVISKWDLLESRYSLTEIKHRILNKIQEFKNQVDNRKKGGCSLFLIPVSCVGRGFATLESNGQIRKNPGMIPQPLNVEIPFALALANEHSEQTSNSTTQTRRNATNNRFVNSLKSSIFIVIVVFVFILAIGFISSYIKNALLYLPIFVAILFLASFALVWFFTKSKQESSKKVTQAASDPESLSTASAFEHVLDTSKYLQKKLVDNFPDSSL